VALRARAAFIFLLALAAAPLFAAGDNLGAAYSAVESEIRAVFSAAEAAGIPTALLMDKLEEGASKSVAPGQLLLALRAEAERLAAGQAALSREKIDLAGAEEKSQALKAISLLFVAGVQDTTVDSLLATSGKRGAADLVEALNTLVQIRLSTGLADNGLATLGTALLESGLPRAAFKSIPRVLFNAAARGMKGEAAAAVLVDVLKSGGGIVQMEEALLKKAGADTAGAQAQGQGSRGRPAAGSAPVPGRTTGSAERPESGTPESGTGESGTTDRHKGD
jgi:hypothetical protein